MDFGEEDGEVKGFGDEIVCPHVDGHDDIDVVGSRGQKQDGHLGDPANFLAPMVPVIEGQGNVHQHQMGLKGSKLPQNVRKVLCAPDGKSPGGQFFPDGGGNDLVVLHQVDTIHRLFSPFCVSLIIPHSRENRNGFPRLWGHLGKEENNRCVQRTIL